MTVLATASGIRAPNTSRPSTPRRLSTPAGLQLLLGVVAVLCVICGTLGAVVAARSAGAAHQLTTATVPAEVQAASIYTSVADADATEATAFLAGGLEPAALRTTYAADIAAAGTALAQIGAPPPGTTAARALADLSAKLPVYTGLIETARANNRQGFPVGGAYLSTASDLAQGTLLADANALLAYEQGRVSDGYSDARSSGSTALLFVALVLSGGVLIVGQIALTRRTNRVINVPLLLSTGLVVGALVATAAVVGVARDRLDKGATASSQIALVTAAQIDALQEKGDESLTLVGRGDDSHEPQFTRAEQALSGSGSLLPRLVDQGGLSPEAAIAQGSYLGYHAAVVKATDEGDFAGSDAAQAAGAGPFATLIRDLGRARAGDQATFTQRVSSVTHPLDALAVVVPVLALLALLASAVGIRLRLREFR